MSSLCLNIFCHYDTSIFQKNRLLHVFEKYFKTKQIEKYRFQRFFRFFKNKLKNRKITKNILVKENTKIQKMKYFELRYKMIFQFVLSFINQTPLISMNSSYLSFVENVKTIIFGKEENLENLFKVTNEEKM